MVLGGVMTFLILLVLKKTIGIRVTPVMEEAGQDYAEHGELAFEYGKQFRVTICTVSELLMLLLFFQSNRLKYFLSLTYFLLISSHLFPFRHLHAKFANYEPIEGGHAHISRSERSFDRQINGGPVSRHVSLDVDM